MGGGAGGMLGKGRNRGGLGAPAGHQEEQVLAWRWWSSPWTCVLGNQMGMSAPSPPQGGSKGSPLGRRAEGRRPAPLGFSWAPPPRPLTWLGVLRTQRRPTGSCHQEPFLTPHSHAGHHGLRAEPSSRPSHPSPASCGLCDFSQVPPSLGLRPPHSDVGGPLAASGPLSFPGRLPPPGPTSRLRGRDAGCWLIL